MASMQKFNLVIRRSVTSLNTVDDYQRIMFASKLARQYFMNNPNSLIDLVKLATETVSASVLNQSFANVNLPRFITTVSFDSCI
jgi:hypothetical protein